MTHTSDIVRPPQRTDRRAQGDRRRDRRRHPRSHGVPQPHMVGPVAQNMGKSIVGPALTLQFMPQRPDLFTEGEYADPETQLHRHALYHVQEGDVVVVDARGDMSSGVFGDMMSTYFKGRGGAGIVIDGCMRDRPNVEQLDLPLVAARMDAELPRADQDISQCRQRSDRVRRRHGNSRRHHRGRRRRVVVVPVSMAKASSRRPRSTVSGKNSHG